MVDDLLEPRRVRLPELAEGTWLNTTQALTKRLLLGSVVLIDFWDYTCVNCLRTLPYLQLWHERYANQGLQILGIHAPEFGFGSVTESVQAAVSELQIPYPVLLDNGFENWERFANKAWPTKYLADADGYLRFRRQGEGYYRETEQAIHRLLIERDPGIALPELLEPLRSEDGPGAVCYRPTPELFAGYQMGGLRGHALGNVSVEDQLAAEFFALPAADRRDEGKIYLDGTWATMPEYIAFSGRASGAVTLRYQAVSVNAVVAPPNAIAGTQDTNSIEVSIEVKQDGRSLTPHNAGADVVLQPDGRSVVPVTRARMFELVRNPGFEAHELTLTISSQGTQLFSFSFTSCTVEDDTLASASIYTMN